MAKKPYSKNTPKEQTGKLSWSRDTDKTPAKGIRLNRYIAHAGVCSRREADQLIADGKIKVNNKVITEMGYKVMPGDKVHHGKKLLQKESYAYVLLNKPKDFITTTKDPKARKTVMELVKKATDARIYPVGRLDRNTTGLLLLTNDGELADKLSHPSNNIKKIYKVEINKPLEEADFATISEGIELEDGKIKVDEIAVLTADAMSIGVELHSGKNRIVRRIFEHFNYEVIRLDRVVYAGLDKSNLPRGKWRHLTEKEIGLLKKKGKARG
jgi:23S rRNA pseudouridine2605 synthase